MARAAAARGWPQRCLPVSGPLRCPPQGARATAPSAPSRAARSGRCAVQLDVSRPLRQGVASWLPLTILRFQLLPPTRSDPPGPHVFDVLGDPRQIGNVLLGVPYVRAQLAPEGQESLRPFPFSGVKGVAKSALEALHSLGARVQQEGPGKRSPLARALTHRCSSGQGLIAPR